MISDKNEYNTNEYVQNKVVSDKTSSEMDRLIPLVPLKKVTQFFRLLLLCKNYSTIILTYENATISLLEPIVLSLNTHISIILNHDLSDYNLDTDQHSLIISLVESNLVYTTRKIRNNYYLNSYCHYMYVTRDQNETNKNFELNYNAKTYHLANIASMFITEDGSFNIFRITYDQDTVAKFIHSSFNDTCGVYNQIFHPKQNDLMGEVRYVSVPIILPTSSNKNGKKISRIGGSHAYFATLIPSKLNITIKLLENFYPYYNLPG